MKITHNDVPAVLEQIQQDLQRVLFLLDSAKEKSKDDDTLMTRQEVVALFKIHMSTLYNWLKSKRLKRICLGGRVYFRYKDIMDIIKSKICRFNYLKSLAKYVRCYSNQPTAGTRCIAVINARMQQGTHEKKVKD